MSTPKPTTVRMQMSAEDVYFYMNGLRLDMDLLYEDSERGDSNAYQNSHIWEWIADEGANTRVGYLPKILEDVNELMDKMERDRKRVNRLKKMIAKVKDEWTTIGFDLCAMDDTQEQMDMMYGACKEYKKRLAILLRQQHKAEKAAEKKWWYKYSKMSLVDANDAI